ncbi:MAG: sialidase family protein [Candidatus Caldarchaeum sp.]
MEAEMKKFSGDSAIRNPKSAMPFLATFYSAILCGGLFATFTYAQSGWGPDTRLVFMQGGGWYPRAACCGDTIHLVWWQHYAHDEVFYKRSTDAGLTWGEDVMLSVEDGQSSVLPEIAVSGNTVHVIWFEDDFGLVYRRSFDGGTTWQQIDSIVPGVDYSSILAMGDTIYIAGITSSGGILKFTKSNNGGNSWLPIIDVTPARANPTLRLVSNNILTLTVSYRALPGVCEIYNVLSFNGGETWLDSQMVSENDGIGSQHPAMDTDDSGGIHITWYDYKYSPYPWTGDIFYRVSRDSGSTWEEIDSLTVMHRAVASDILAEGTNLHLVWEDDRNGFDNNFEIYYRMSTDLGRTWGPEERLTNAPYHSYCPSLACGGGYLHLFWQDRREYGNNGPSAPIYYKRKDLSVGIKENVLSSCSSSSLFLNCPAILAEKTLICYDLGKNKNGEINLIDVTGRVIGTVPVHQVSGELVFPFNKEVQDGVYFLMLKAGKECVIKKVVKVK